MKGDTVLDLVVFQLTAPRTRCELFVSADGMTEKLASGFLKPFLNHLRAVEEQVAGGRESVKLECPQTYNGRSWFTKGTLERFVRFVSTPEVLERVKSIEDELVQLEQVRSIQASGLPQAEDPFLGADPIYLRKDGKAFSGPLGKSGASKLVGNFIQAPKRYPYYAIESGSEASKVELLRAMDVRLLALRQEQSTAFERAAAAGFSSGNMTDLMAFSEYFGADRLRVACINFLIVSQRRVAEPTKHNLQAISNGCDMLLPNAGVLLKREDLPQASARLLSQSNRAHMPNGKHYSEDERALMVKDGLLSEETDSDGLPSKGTGGSEVRKRWGPPANIRPELCGDQNRIDAASANINVEAPSINMRAHNQEPSRPLMNDAAERQAHILGDPVQDNSLVLKHTTASKMDQSFESQVVPNVVIDPHQSNSFPNKQTSNIVKPNASHVQEHNKDTISAPARRLSVQDAISLFEDKKKKELVKAPGKHCLGKQESGRASMEGTNASSSGRVYMEGTNTSSSGRIAMEGTDASSSGTMASRRQSAANGSEIGEVLQGNQESRKGTGDVLLPRQDLHAVESQVIAPPKASDSSFQQLYPTMKAEETSSKVSATKEQNVGLTIGKLHDPTHLKLEKSTSQGTLARDLPVKQGPSKCDSNLSITRTDDSGDRKPETTDSRSREPQKVSLSNGLRQLMPIQDSSILQRPLLEVDAAQRDPKISMASSEIKQANVVKEERRKDATPKVFVDSEMATNQSSRRESFGSSRVDSFHYCMQEHVGMDVNQASVDVEYLSEHRGRFYEQYSKLRDAKLMEENDFRRAQREAKLRSMKETLLQRKAELDAQAMRHNHHEARAAKLQARRDDFYMLRREKEDGGDERYSEISGYSNGHSISPSFTPLAGKEQASASKSQSGRKSAAGSRKGAIPPRSATRGTSVSPKLTPRSATGSTTKPRKSENPLAKSVPSFANLRKENTKPSAGRPSGNAGLLAKDEGSGRFRDVSEAHPLEANVNGLVCTPPPGNGPAKDDKVHGASFVRKSYADVKILSTSKDDGVSAPPQEVESETIALSKSKHDGAGPFQEAKQSAEEGSNTGPLCLRGVIQQLPLPTVEATYDSNEERGPITLFLESNRTDGNQQIPEEIKGTISQRDAAYYEVDNMDIDVTDKADFASESGSTQFRALQMIATADASGDRGPPLDIQGVTERACHTLSFPVDSPSGDRRLPELDVQGVTERARHTLSFPVDSPSNEPNLREALECYPQSQVQDANGNGSQSRYMANGSTSFRASSLPHQLHLPVFFNGSASPPNSRIVHAHAVSGHFSPPLESPLESPANWKSSQTHCASEEAEIPQMNKKWAGSQKVAMVSSTTKEPAKGFKRLLKFARKNRTLDAATADWVSTSEGDDETEDQRLSIDELNTRGRLEERIVFDISGEQNTTPDQVSAGQSLRSSIPTPPTNFRLRDDHLMGSTMLKAPKSFFSLSSFRNKGIEGKAR